MESNRTTRAVRPTSPGWLPVALVLVSLLAPGCPAGPGPVEDSACAGSLLCPDEDGDGYGAFGGCRPWCDAPAGWVADRSDCDDGDASVHPGADEACDGADQDCDGEIDEEAVDASTWCADADGDGYGDAAVAEAACESPGSGWVSNGHDCDDGDPAVNPDADDRDDDGVDDDCDGFVDCFMSLADADAAFYGDEGGSLAGISVADAGDVDGDGYPDILVGAPHVKDGDGEFVGAVYLVSGSADLLTGGDQWLADATARVEGRDRNDFVGYAVAGAGDVDGDGFGDVLLGAPCFCVCDTSGNGAALLFRGPLTGDIAFEEADTYLIGEADGDWAGISLSSGDFDSDGNRDVLVGSWYNDALAELGGAAYLVYGPITDGYSNLSNAGARLMGSHPVDAAGTAVAGAGDINGDGVEDILVGGMGVWLVHGPPVGDLDLDMADARLTRESMLDNGGNTLSGAGDVNADGYDDFLVGAHDDSTRGAYTGAAYLLYGPVTGQMSLGQADAKMIGERAGSYAGEVGGGEDFDQDGFDDLLVSAYWEPNRDEQWGAVYVVRGPVSGSMGLEDAYLKMMGEEYAGAAGKSVDYVDDMDEDGFPEVLIGAHWTGKGGAAYLVRGR